MTNLETLPLVVWERICYHLFCTESIKDFTALPLTSKVISSYAEASLYRSAEFTLDAQDSRYSLRGKKDHKISYRIIFSSNKPPTIQFLWTRSDVAWDRFNRVCVSIPVHSPGGFANYHMKFVRECCVELVNLIKGSPHLKKVDILFLSKAGDSKPASWLEMDQDPKSAGFRHSMRCPPSLHEGYFTPCDMDWATSPFRSLHCLDNTAIIIAEHNKAPPGKRTTIHPRSAPIPDSSICQKFPFRWPLAASEGWEDTLEGSPKRLSEEQLANLWKLLNVKRSDEGDQRSILWTRLFDQELWRGRRRVDA